MYNLFCLIFLYSVISMLTCISDCTLLSSSPSCHHSFILVSIIISVLLILQLSFCHSLMNGRALNMDKVVLTPSLHSFIIVLNGCLGLMATPRVLKVWVILTHSDRSSHTDRPTQSPDTSSVKVPYLSITQRCDYIKMDYKCAKVVTFTV